MKVMWSISQLCEFCKKSDKTIRAKLADLPFTLGPKGAKLYESHTALALIYQDVGDLSFERAKLTRLQAQEKQMRIDLMKGDLVRIEEVGTAIDKEYAIIKAQFRAMPSHLAKQLSGISEPSEINARLAAAVNDVLMELSQDAKYQLERSSSATAANSNQSIQEADQKT